MAHHNLIVLLFLLVSLISNTTWQSMAAQAATSDDDLETLLTIKKDWGDPPALSSWSSQNTAFCSWTGVTSCNNGRVTALSFQKFHIAGPFPASICNLTGLSHLDLSYNNLTGPFPTALYHCSALQYLDLSYNLLSGVLPADIDKLSPAMEHLNLSSNGFAGSVPLTIAGFPKLVSLVLDSNSFNGTYPGAAIAGLSKLEMLNLAVNPFAPGPIPEEFGKLRKLKTLWLFGMNLTGSIPDALSLLTELSSLALYTNMLDGPIPAWVWKLQKLQFLYLYQNRFTGRIGPDVTAAGLLHVDLSTNRLTGPIPHAFGDLKNLTALFVYQNRITGAIPTRIGLLPNLTDIRISDNNLSGPLPPELGRYSPLVNLEVANNNLTGDLPDTLCFNKRLQDIVLLNNKFSGMFPAILGDCVTVNNIMVQDNSFTGEFPEKVWSAFPGLTIIQIQNNGFTGSLPNVISSGINRIDISNNRFSGTVPASAAGLQNFNAENNLFSGPLPASMSAFANLTILNLAGNMISGSLPPSISTWQKLTSLNLSGNQISGTIPPAMGSLPLLLKLDLSNNELTGHIPPEFNNLHVNFLNLSSNQLTGEVPESLKSWAYEGAFLRNPGLCATANLNSNLPACSRGVHNQMQKVLIILLSLAAGISLVGGVAVCAAVRRLKRRQHETTWKMTAFHKLSFTEYNVLSKLQEADVIGSGGSGKVYRVDVGGSTVVAVKRLWNTRKADEKLAREFESEVKILGEIRHNNIVSLLCCISGEDAKLLVYEYMENGSLHQWLHRQDPAGCDALDWPTRLGIAIDAARGLSYMHHECEQPIMHRDVKSTNILLDPRFRAKIADFGLARILTKSGEPESVSAVGGTFGYMAPECGRGVKVNEKVDVYSFGVVLLELTTGRVANDNREECCLVEWAWRRYKVGGTMEDVVDRSIIKRDGAVFVEDALAVFLLGVVCTGDDVVSRPSMKQVLQQLVQYDRTANVAGACRDDRGGSVQLPMGKSTGSQDKALPSWPDGDEESGSFVARPV